jgi:hypothetical protein
MFGRFFKNEVTTGKSYYTDCQTFVGKWTYYLDSAKAKGIAHTDGKMLTGEFYFNENKTPNDVFANYCLKQNITTFIG